MGGEEKSESKQEAGPTPEARDATRASNALNKAILDSIQPELLENLGFQSEAQLREGAVTQGAANADIARSSIRRRSRRLGETGSQFERSALSQVDISQLSNISNATTAVKASNRGQALSLFSALQGNPVIGQQQSIGTSKSSALSFLV